jgi:tyrosyl-DNA phosphodiesterase-1
MAAPSSSWSEEQGEEGSLPVCIYGEKCYRNNPQHFQEFAHPWLDDAGPPSEKRRKLGDSRDDPVTLSPDPQTSPDSPFTLSPHSLFYLTTARGVDSRHNSQDIAIAIRDLLSPLMGDLVCSAQFNYLIDLPWLLQQYPPEKRKCPLLVVHGDQKDANIRKAAAPYPNVTLFKARLEIMFGTHHSKMMLLAYREGLRVVIHTANLIPKDWDQKTQGVWVSPLFPAKSSVTPSKSETVVNGGKETGFKQDLLEYLKAYGGRGLEEWKQRISDHDLSAARWEWLPSGVELEIV